MKRDFVTNLIKKILTENSGRIFATFLLGLFILVQPFSVVVAPAVDNQHNQSTSLDLKSVLAYCANECVPSGIRRCSTSNSYQFCGNYDNDSCLEWSSSYPCGSGKTCSNGQCVTGSSCDDQCSPSGQRKCYNSNRYQFCGNYDNDSCLEWSSSYPCGGGKVCQNGYCVTQCTSHDYQSCYNNDLYWYDSCNQREEKVEECGEDSWTNNYQCSGDWVQRRKRKRGCSNNSCYDYYQWENYQDCSAQGKVCQNGQCVSSCQDQCSPSGTKKCSDNTHYQFCGNYDNDSCLEWSSSYPCGSGKVCQNGECITQCASHSYKQCYSNDLYWYDSCNQREEKAEECGEDSCGCWGLNYCFGGDVYHSRTCYHRGCSNNYCYESSYTDTEMVEDCGVNETCQNGQCVATCQDQCSPSGQRECSGTSGRTCGDYDQDQCLEWSSWNNCDSNCYSCGDGNCDSNCGEDCSTCSIDCGSCCTSHDYQSCYNNDLYWYDSCNNREEQAEECGEDSYSSWNYYCENEDLYKRRTYYQRGCSNNQCYENSSEQTQLVEDCGQDYCGNWGSNFCENNDVYHQRTCYDKGCSNNSCYSSSYTDKELVEECISGELCQNGSCSCASHSYKQCYNNGLYWYDSCDNREEKAEECGEDSWTNNYQCSADWVQRRKRKRGCSNNSCYDFYQWENYQDCSAQGKTCQNGQCVATCQDQCSASGQKECSGNSGRTCGDYDSDSCLEWSDWNNCDSNCYFCGDGNCDSNCGEDSSNCSPDCGPVCQNQCSYSNQRRCSTSNSYQICGNYDNDSCLEWSSSYPCGSGKTCSNGYCVSFCQDQCSYNGQRKCYSSNEYRICGNYDSDSCLEWSSSYICQGNNYCGYGNCTNSQRPNWYCSNGNCTYNCNYDSSCNYSPYDPRSYKACYNNDVYWYDSNDDRQSKYQECGSDSCGRWENEYCIGNSVYQKRTCYNRGCANSSCYSNSDQDTRKVKDCDPDQECRDGECVEVCECSSGPCCDGCHYQDDSETCDIKVDVQYGCPWGTSCGADLGQRTRVRYRYCSGSSSKCTGDWSNWTSWAPWIISDHCASQEICELGKKTCSYSSECITPAYSKHAYKSCYHNDLYWYDSDKERQDKYQECDDKNSCTIDSCSDSACHNELNCDGSTCKVSSPDYCDSCEHCGDEVCNCEEGPCSCREDCGFSAALITKQVRNITQDSSWSKSLEVKPEQKLAFSITIRGAGIKPLTDIQIREELPENLIYQDNLVVEGSSSEKDITKGLTIAELGFNQSKKITFEAKVNSADKFEEQKNLLLASTNVSYNESVSSDSVQIKVVKPKPAAPRKAAATLGALLSYLGNWKFWVTFVAILIIFAIIWLLRRFFRTPPE